jgi:hypothetical protein
MSAVWMVPFLMFALVTTNAAVALVAEMSTATIAAASTAFKSYLLVDDDCCRTRIVRGPQLVLHWQDEQVLA